MIRLGTVVVALGLAVSFAGCAEEGTGAEVIELINTTEEGSTDAVWDKRIVAEKAQAVYFEGTEYEGVSKVLDATANQVRVESDVIIVRPGFGGDVEIDVETGMFGADMRFMLFYRLAGSQAEWTTMELNGTSSSLSGTHEITVNFFDHIRTETARDQLHLSDGRNFNAEYTVPFRGFRQSNMEYGLWAFPVEDWGSLEGDHSYVYQITCNGGPCSLTGE